MKYDLVFEGGGAKGMVLVGAYEEFVRRGHTHGRLLGTSAGAITAALLAAGYTSAEMLTALDERENAKPVFSGFMGQPSPFTPAEIRASAIRTFLRNINLKFVPDFIEERLDNAIAEILARDPRSSHLFAFVERGGWYAADRFVAWLRAKLDSGSWQGGQRKFSQMTLAQFFDTTQVELSVVASDTTESHLLVLNHRTAPDCPLVWAVRMSMSIPFVWDEVIWQADWGTYLGRDLTDHAIVDGGLLSNFPLELFISDEPQVTALMGAKQSNAVLGLLIDESLPVAPADRGILVDINVKPAELRTVQRILRLVDTATTAHDKMVIDAFSHLVVRLPAQGYGTTEFDMSDERRAALVAAGRDAMRTYFDNPPTAPDGSRDIEDTTQPQAMNTANRIAKRLLDRAEAFTLAPEEGVSPQGVADMTIPDNPVGPGPNKWALLIGINEYPKLPPEKQLKGCVNDVNAIEAVLLGDQFRFPRANVKKLVNQEATRDGILAAFRTHLVNNQNIHSGDAVIVYYSGHGSYIKDMHGDEANGYDQTIVPYDSSRRSAEEILDITDDELERLLDDLSQRTKNINLFFDSCNSGTITRDLGESEGLERWLEPWEKDVPLQSQLPGSGGTRGMGPSEWLPLSEGYVLIAGCQADERSREYAFAKSLLPIPTVQHGALTYYLLKALAEVDQNTTYYDIWDQVRLLVTDKNPAQHPQIEGAFERQVFGGAALPRKRYVQVMEKTAQTVTLAAGLAHGATAGSRFAIYAPGTQTFEDAAGRVATVQLSAIDAFRSVGQIEEGDPGQVAVGAPAIEIEHNYGTMQMAVRVQGTEAVLESVRQAVGESPLLHLVTGDDQPSTATVRVRRPLLEDGTEDTQADQKLYILSSSNGLSLVEPVALEDNAAFTLLNKLEHIAKYNNILAIRNTDTNSKLKGKIKVRLLNVTKDAHDQEQFEPVKRTDGGDIVLKVDDRIVLEIENQSDRPLHVTVLDCNTEWQVKPIFPPAGAGDDVVQAKQTRRTNRFKVSLPDYQKAMSLDQALPQETVKVIATTERIDFRPLWLEAMRDGEKNLEAIEGADSSLFHLIGLTTDGGTESATRSFDEDADPVLKDWTTDELACRITT